MGSSLFKSVVGETLEFHKRVPGDSRSLPFLVSEKTTFCSKFHKGLGRSGLCQIDHSQHLRWMPQVPHP